MTRTLLTTLAALALATPTLAQYGYPGYGMDYGVPGGYGMFGYGTDFSSVDWQALVQQQSNETQAYIWGIVQQALAQRGPEIQGAYRRCLQMGYYCGRSFEEFALEFVTTNGFTDGGSWSRQNQANLRQLQQSWAGVQQAEAASRDAIAGLNAGFAANTHEAGNTLLGNSTYLNPGTGAQHVLPHTWQPGGYYQHQGQTYYVNPSGQYYWVDPNNTGWMYPLAPWQR
jgi:hypothetical protein